MVYKEFKHKLISDLEIKKDMLVVENKKQPESLFGIKDKSDKLYMNILQWFEMIAIQNVENLVARLCESKGVMNYKNFGSKSSFDMEIEIKGERRYVEFKSQPNTMNSETISRMLYRIKENNTPVIMVFLLKDGIESREVVARFESRIREIDDSLIECMLFEEFLEMLFGEDEKRAFQEEMADFKEEMHKAIGYQVTELCSPYNLDKLKKELEKEIVNFQYDAIKDQRHADMIAEGSTVDDLNDYSFSIIKKTFLEEERYKLLFGNADFAESYLTSEWLYKKYFSLDELDNTFIVAGFLKSIEQLLWDIIFIVGQGRDIRGIEISEETEDAINKTLGSLECFITNWSNKDLIENSFGKGKRYVINYLKYQIADWRSKYRNGYFHKHNLKNKEKIEAIREETYFLYLLILGTIKLTPAQISILS